MCWILKRLHCSLKVPQIPKQSRQAIQESIGRTSTNENRQNSSPSGFFVFQPYLYKSEPRNTSTHLMLESRYIRKMPSDFSHFHFHFARAASWLRNVREKCRDSSWLSYEAILEMPGIPLRFA